jgi:integrase
MVTLLSPVTVLSALAEEHRLTEFDTLQRKLSDRLVRTKKPEEKPKKIADGGGLTLYIPPSGNRVWHYRFRLEGKPQTYTLGPYPEVSLAVARQMHRAAAWLVERGQHPKDFVAAAVARESEAKRAGVTFGEVCSAWLEAADVAAAKSSAANRRSMLARYVLPKLGDKPIAEVSRKDIVAVLETVDALYPVTAKHCRIHVKQLFDYATDRELVAGNPIPSTKVLVHYAAREEKARKALPLSRIPEFFDELDAAEETSPITKLAFRLLVLTWCRTSEVAGARWSEFDQERKNWTIPASRMKGRVEHVVRLSNQARKILKAAEDFFDPMNPEYVFPSRSGTGGMCRTTLSEWLKRHGFGKDADVHGFRAMASTWANETMKYPEILAEKALAHQQKDRIKAAYDRAKHEEPLRGLWQAWADKIDSLVVEHRAKSKDAAKPVEEVLG